MKHIGSPTLQPPPTYVMSKCSIFNTLLRYTEKPLKKQLFNTFNDLKATPELSTDIGLHVCYSQRD